MTRPDVPDQTVDGPVTDKLKMLLAAVVAAGIGLVLLLVFATVFNLDRGTRSGYLGPEEQSAVARVSACERLWPVSHDGLATGGSGTPGCGSRTAGDQHRRGPLDPYPCRGHMRRS